MGMGDKEEGEDATQLRVVPSQCAVEPGHVGVASDTTEASFRLQYSGGAPAPDHLPAPPALHAAREVAHLSDQILDQIRRLKRALEATLRRGIGRAELEADQASARRDRNDVAGALHSHDQQDRARHVHRAYQARP